MRCLVVILLLLLVSPAKATEWMRASWYGYESVGQVTASGARFDPHCMTAAHPSLPFGTKLLVIRNGKTVVVTITDRGPFIPGRDVDLSLGAAERLGMVTVGVDWVAVEVLLPE